MRHYPIFLDLRGRRAVVIGGGKVAERKIQKLISAGASVQIISPELTRGLARLAAENKITVTRRRYRQGDLPAGRSREAPLLVFAATNDAAAQQAVRKDAQAAGAVYVGFVLDRTGGLSSAGIVEERSVDSDLLKRAALRIVKSSGPFVAFPPSFKEATMAIVVPIEFSFGSE